MTCEKLYEVRVTRSYQEEFVDLIVRACSEAKAVEIAEREAKANSVLWFGQSDAIIEADDAEDLGPDFDPDCEVIE